MALCNQLKVLTLDVGDDKSCYLLIPVLVITGWKFVDIETCTTPLEFDSFDEYSTWT